MESQHAFEGLSRVPWNESRSVFGSLGSCGLIEGRCGGTCTGCGGLSRDCEIRGRSSGVGHVEKTGLEGFVPGTLLRANSLKQGD